MIVRGLLMKCVTILKAGWGVLSCTVLAAAGGALAAGLFGLLFGVLCTLTSGDHGRTVLVAVFFSVCGATAGALTGAFVRVVDPEGVADVFAPHAKTLDGRGSAWSRDEIANRRIARWWHTERTLSDGYFRSVDPSLN